MNRNNLEPIEPQEAVSWYLEAKENECSPNTVKAHNYRLNHLVRWCDERDIDNLNTLSGRDLHRYKQLPRYI